MTRIPDIRDRDNDLLRSHFGETIVPGDSYNAIGEETGIMCAPPKTIGLESLDLMFQQSDNPTTCCCRGKCRHCGIDVTIKITKTSGGYGLLGGVLLEPGMHDDAMLCANCFARMT